MNARFLVVGSIAAAVAIFVWQTLSNAVLPWHMATMREFPDNAAVVQAVRASAPENGVYYSNQGILAAVAFTPDLADKSGLIGVMLGRQFVINVVTAFLLALVTLRLRPATIIRSGIALGTAGLAASILIELSNWNWYGFGLAWSTVNVIDHTIQWFIAGVVLAAVGRRLLRGTATSDVSSGTRVPAGAGVGHPSTR